MLLRRDPLLGMPDVAARTATTIAAASGLEREGGLGAVTPRTEEPRTCLPSIYPASAAIDRPLRVRTQRPDMLARLTPPAADNRTMPYSDRRYKGAGRIAEDAPVRNGRRHHLS